MAEVKIRWTQRVMGRSPGDEETVERTGLIEAMAAQGRVVILDAVADHIELLMPADEPVENTVTEAVPATVGDGSLDDLPVPTPADVIRPGPRPRPRQV